MDPESTSFDALMAQGMAASQADDSVQAIACFKHAGKLRAGAGLPQFLLGSEYAALGEMDNAETAFANATRLAPDFSIARYQLGLLQFSSGRAAIALLTWQPLLQLPDSDALPHFVNGFSALAQDSFDEALDHFERGLALNKTNSALSGDIQKVVSGIKALAGNTPSDEFVEGEATHVLLANYRQQGQTH